MFQVIPEPAFEAWYEELPEPLAEEVATAIDLVASSSELVAPERLSRSLLWFDGTSGLPNAFSDSRYERRTLSALPVTLACSYVAWHHEVLLCLESPAFEQRLAALDAGRAALALRQVERLRRKLHAARVSSSYGLRAAAPSAAGGADALGLRRAFLDLLGQLGLDPELVLSSGSGLRELCIDNVSPGLRVLFGLDFPRRRLLAILGESLDRRYYGDSVRLAETRWQRYCDELSGQRAASTP
jgi:hypothetical protein